MFWCCKYLVLSNYYFFGQNPKFGVGYKFSHIKHVDIFFFHLVINVGHGSTNITLSHFYIYIFSGVGVRDHNVRNGIHDCARWPCPPSISSWANCKCSLLTKSCCCPPSELLWFCWRILLLSFYIYIFCCSSHSLIIFVVSNEYIASSLEHIEWSAIWVVLGT